MNPQDKRDEQKAQLESRDLQNPKRFLLVRLEERIAPVSSGGSAGVFGGGSTGSYAGTSR